MFINLTVPMPVSTDGTGEGEAVDVGGMENLTYDMKLDGAVLTGNLEGSYSSGGQPNDPNWTTIAAIADGGGDVTAAYARVRLNVSAYTSGTPRVEFNGVRR